MNLLFCGTAIKRFNYLLVVTIKKAAVRDSRLSPQHYHLVNSTKQCCPMYSDMLPPGTLDKNNVSSLILPIRSIM